MELSQKLINSVYQRFEAQQATCIICGQQFHQIGIFVPYNQNEIEASEVKLRSFFYPVCNVCQDDPQSISVIEAFAFKNFRTEH